MKTGFVFFLITIIGICSCKTSNNKFEIKDNLVTITGIVENYKGVYKTGKLTYFDAVTREIQDKIFTIYSLGNFGFSFNLAHPVINSIYFDIEGNYYSDFLIEPKKNYHITFKENGFQFNNESGEHNREISKFKNALYYVFEDKINKTDRLHEQGLSIEEYIEYQKKLENEKLTFLNSYFNKHSISEKLKSVLQSEIKFTTAHAWINYRFDYSEGFPKPRTTLPEYFYDRLFTEYAVQNIEDFQSRACIDYISNIVSVLSSEAIKIDEKIAYFKSFLFFSPNEIEMLSKVLRGDRSIAQTEEFNNFIKINERNIMELNWRYNVQFLL
jgi:hypothetical protein